MHLRRQMEPCPAPELDKLAEQRALRTVVMTSRRNQSTRMLLGCVYVYAAVKFGVWMLHPSGGSTLRSRLYELDTGAITQLALTWTGCLCDLYFAGVWASSGWAGL